MTGYMIRHKKTGKYYVPTNKVWQDTIGKIYTETGPVKNAVNYHSGDKWPRGAVEIVKVEIIVRPMDKVEYEGLQDSTQED